MPTSHFHQLNEIVELIVLTDPKSVLDVGVGFGKYGLLAREYLDVWGRGREVYGDWKRRIDGIEAFRGYLTPLHDFIYDNVYVGNAIDVLPTLQSNYDLILLVDVLEHLEYRDGVKLLEACEARGKNIIVSTPKDIGPEVVTFDNPFETHRFQWKKSHFTRYANGFFLRNSHSLIFYTGVDASRVRRGLKVRSRGLLTYLQELGDEVAKRLPILRIPYGAIKNTIL